MAVTEQPGTIWKMFSGFSMNPRVSMPLAPDTVDRSLSPAPSAASLSARTLRTVAQLEELREYWIAWQHHPNSDLDFYLTILKSRPEIVRPHVVALFRAGAPVALLVGRLESSKLDVKFGYKTLLRPSCRSLIFLYAGLLGDGSLENCEALVTEIRRSLQQGEGDVAFFNGIKDGTALQHCLFRNCGSLTRDRFPERRLHRSLTLPETFADFYSSLSGRTRKHRRKEASDLLRDNSGDVVVRVLSARDQVELILRDVEEIASKTYHRGLGVGFSLADDSRARFHFEATAGRLRTFLLYVAGRPGAYWIATRHGDTLHTNFTGYDPSLCKYSPGTFLLFKLIEHAIDEGITKIDFGTGDAWYKEVYSNVSWQEIALFAFAPTLRGIGLNLLRTPVLFADRLARHLLGRTAFLNVVKRFWREAMTPRAAG